MTEYVCMYCRAERHDECDDLACWCCYGGYDPAYEEADVPVVTVELPGVSR